MFKLDDKVGARAMIYLIVCSRGAGSETMTAKVWKPLEEALEESRIDEDGDDVSRYVNSLSQSIKDGGEQLCAGVQVIDTEFNDEGMTYLVEADVTYRQMLEAILKSEDEYATEECELEKRTSYRSAVYRAVVNNLEIVDRNETKWSSIGAWRSTECERMPLWQVQQCLELFKMTKEQALVCDCVVLRESIVKPSEEYCGC